MIQSLRQVNKPEKMLIIQGIKSTERKDGNKDGTGAGKCACACASLDVGKNYFP